MEANEINSTPSGKQKKSSAKKREGGRNSLPMAMSWRFFFAASSTSAVSRLTSACTGKGSDCQ
jgi:hypothetical protein